MGTDNRCGLCNENENMFHLMWECEYPQKVWKQIGKIIEVLEQNPDPPPTRINAYHVMYASKISTKVVNANEVMVLMMEIKRDILHRHFKRLVNDRLNRIENTRERILCHIINVVDKIIRYRKYVKQKWDFFNNFGEEAKTQLEGANPIL